MVSTPIRKKGTGLAKPCSASRTLPVAPLRARSVTPTRAATPGSRSSPVQSRMVISVTISARWPASGSPARRGGKKSPAERPMRGTARARVLRRMPPRTAASIRLIARRHPPTLMRRSRVTRGRGRARLHDGEAMPTHQPLSGSSDEALLRRMIETHGERFGPKFWAFFAAHVGNRLPPRPVMVDLGCGPGLFLRDLGERYPGATLYGYDVTPAMIAHGRELSYGAAEAMLTLHDGAAPTVP